MPNVVLQAIMFVGTLVMEALPVLEVVFGIGAGTTAVVGALAITAGVVGMSKLMEMSLPRPDSNYARQKTVRTTTAPVKRVYGESLISGPVAFMGVSGTGNQDLWHVIALTGDKSESITDIYLDNVIIPNADINSGNALGGAVNGTTTIFKPIDSNTLVTVYKYLGGQTAASNPVDSEFFKWTSDHKGQGLTYIATKFSFPDNEKIAEIWNKYNPQDIKALVKGMAVYDPRKDSTSDEYDSSLGVSTQRLADSTTWQWSDNPALCLANYILDDDFGMGVSSSLIDWSAVHVAADYADALVSIPGSQTQKRFTCNGVLYGTDSHSQNINKILSSMNGSLVYSSGKYVMQAGQYIAPESDAILTDDDLTGPINITVANTRDSRFNTIKGTHFNPLDLHKKVAFPEVQLTDIATRDAGEVLYKEVELPMTNDVYMCQRLTYQMINRSNDQMLIEFPCNLKALRYTVGDRVKITLDKFAGSDSDSISFNETPFVILGFNFSAEGGVTLTLLKDTQANYTDMPVGNYSSIASDGSITDGFSGVPAPTNLGSVVNGHDVRLTWDNPVPNSTFNDIIVYQSDTSNFSDSSIFLRTKSDAVTFVLPSTGTTKYYWVRASLYDNEVAATDIIIGQTYRIRTLGNTSWTSLGASAPVNNGDTFVATASGTSSSGTGVATDESAVSAVVGPETVTTTDQVADSVEWVDVDNTAGLRPDNNATVGATLGTNVYDGQAQAYAVGDLLNSNGFFRFTRTSADDDVSAPADASAFNTAFGRNPTDGDIVVVTNTASTPDKQAAYQYDGTQFGTISGFFAGDLIINDTVTAAALSVTELGAITADLGTITGGTLKGGDVPDADAAPSGSESGSFFDLTDGKFVVGDATNNILFDGSSLSVTGTVNASSGAFTGDVSTDSKFIAGSGDATTVVDGGTDATYRIFSGAAEAESENAPFQVKPDGSVFAKNITVFDASGNILLNQDGLGAAALAGISLTSGTAVDKVSGVLSGDGGEMTLTLDQTATVTLETKFAIYDNSVGTLYLRGTGATSSAALSDITNATLNIIYSLQTDGGSYSTAATKPITFTSTDSTPSSTEVYVTAVQVGGSYLTILMDAGGALEYIANTSTYGATAYVVTSHTFTNLPAGVHKVKLSSTITGSGSPAAAGQSTSNRLYELRSSAINFVESAANVFANGTPSVPTGGGTVSGNLVVTGDLTVNGTTTTVNTDDLTVKDNNITLNYATGDSSSTANNAGITIQDAVDASTDASILWKTASDSFEFSHPVKDLSLTGDLISDSSIYLRSAGGVAGVYLQDTSGGSTSTAFRLYSDVDSTTVNIDTGGSQTIAAFVNNGNLLITGTIFADGAASNSLQWETGYDYSQIGHLPLAGGTLTGAVSWPSGSSTNANTAYTYSQVGHLPLAGGTLTGTLTIAGSSTNGISLKLRSGENSTGTDSTQIRLGYDNSDDYSHKIASRHHASQDSTNAIDFYVWDYGTDATGDIGTKRVLIVDGYDEGVIYTPNLGVNTTDNTVFGGTQVYIKRRDENTNLMRWGEGDVNNQDSYRFRLDQDFKFIANSGSGDVLTIDSSDGSIEAKSLAIATTANAPAVTITSSNPSTWGASLIVGATTANQSLVDSADRPMIIAEGAYPVFNLNHTVTTNADHGPTIQFTVDGYDSNRQVVIGTDGQAQRLDFGFSGGTAGTNTNKNPHNGIAGLNGITAMRLFQNGLLVGATGASPNEVTSISHALDVRGSVLISDTTTSAAIRATDDGTDNTYQGVIKTVNTGSDQWSHITLGGAAANSTINNTYIIGRGAAISDRNLSFHVPNAAQYSDTTQPKFLFASSGADTLMTITASTGDVFVKGGAVIQGVGTFGQTTIATGRAIINTSSSSSWSTHSYPYIGSNGTPSIVMIHNPHLPFRTDNKRTGATGRAGVRMAIDANATSWWDAGLTGDQYEIYRNASQTQLFALTNGGNATFAGTVTATGTSLFETIRLTDSSKMGFGTVIAGGSVNHTANTEEGIFWHTSRDVYSIYRTSGAWTSPDYQQLAINWPTGIIIDGGASHGLSGVDIKTSGTSRLKVESNGQVVSTNNNFLIGGNYTNNAYNSTSGARLLFGGGDASAKNSYYIGTNMEDVNGNYTKLDFRWHTGIRMGAQGQYGGIRFYNDEDLTSKLMSIGEGANVTTVKVYNDLHVQSNIGVGIASATGLSGARIVNVYGGAGAHGQFVSEGANGTQFVVLNSGVSANNSPSIYAKDELRFALATNKDATGFSEKFSMIETGLLVGPSAGTAYNTISSYNLFFGAYDSSNGLAYSIGTKRLENIGGNYTKLNIDWHTGITLGAATNYGGIRFFDNSVGHYDSTTELMSVGRGDNHVRIANDLYLGGELRSSYNVFANRGTTVWTYEDNSSRAKLYVSDTYPVITLNAETNTNANHGATIQWSGSGYDNRKQWVIGSGNTVANLDFGWAKTTNSNPHYGIAGLGQGYGHATLMRLSESGVGLGGNWGYYGTLQTPAFPVHILGNLGATGNVTAYYSDERLKTRTGGLTDALQKVNSLEGFTYVENDLAKELGYDNQDQQVGVSAQQVQEILPEAVSLAPIDITLDEETGERKSKSGEDYLTVDYSRLVPLLVEAIKELTDKVEILEDKLEEK